MPMECRFRYVSRRCPFASRFGRSVGGELTRFRNSRWASASGGRAFPSNPRKSFPMRLPYPVLPVSVIVRWGRRPPGSSSSKILRPRPKFRP